MEEIKLFGPYQIFSRQEAIKKGLKHYFTGKPCKYGHISRRRVNQFRCLACALRDVLNWQSENPERSKQHKRTSVRKFPANNPEKAKEQTRKSVYKWNKNNPEIKALINRNIGRVNDLIEKGLLPIGGGHSRSIGCNAHQFKAHIESQFVDGMSWDNFDQIEIDHIRPISSFSDLLNNIEQSKVCLNYRNIQPLWMKENRDKSDEYTPLDELA